MTNKDKLRAELYKEMKPFYKLAKKYGVNQLHFHLKNNESFLRMHKPKKFGDNLTKIRYSVAYVNRRAKPISGFEQGRITHGYRYVYPIKNKDGVDLGSVEISMGSKAFEKFFENTLFLDANFIINKKISQEKVFQNELDERYSISLQSSLYLKEKEGVITNRLLLNIKKDINAYQKKIQNKLLSKKAFAIDISTQDGYYTQSFIPVKNIKEKKVIAYFIVSSKSGYLDNLHKDTLILKATLFFFTLMVIYIIDRNLNYSHKLREEVRVKTKELEDSQKKVVQAQKMASLGMLITGVAHEINTPIGLSITAITNLIDETKILKKDYTTQVMDEKEFENYLENSIKASDIVFINLIRTAELVKNFKQLSTNQALHDKIEVDVNSYMKNIINTMDNKIKEKNVTIELNIEKDLKIFIYADVLPQIFNNFISNSLTHAFLNIQNPKIQIAIKKEKDIIISYYDNGIGMDEDSIKKLFDPFYTTNRGAGNSGLGMHVIYSLITDKLEGNIDVTSKINNGVHFKITLPIKGN